MAIVNPTPITPLPTPPTTQDPVNFDTRADAFLGQLPDFTTQANALASVTFGNATDSAASATDALASKNAAATSETNALASKNAAATSATNASTSETNALASKNAAALSATDADTSKNAAALSASDALTYKNAASASATLALQYRNEAETFARTQMTGTSTTSMLIAVGSKSFTIEANKPFIAGQYILVASSANASNYMSGTITSYNSTSGAIVVSIDDIGGSGTFADWKIGLAAKKGDSSSFNVQVITVNTTAASGIYYIFGADVTLTVPASLMSGFRFGFGTNGVKRGRVQFGSHNVKGISAGLMEIQSANNSAAIMYSGDTSVGFVQI